MPAKFLEPICKEIATDPLGRNYSEMTDQQVADSLNAEITEHRLVHQDEIKAWATKYRVLKRLIDANKGDTPLYKECELLFTGSQELVDMSNPGAQAIVNDLVSEGIITQEEAAELSALAEEKTTRAKQLGVHRPITAEWVKACREAL